MARLIGGRFHSHIPQSSEMALRGGGTGVCVGGGGAGAEGGYG